MALGVLAALFAGVFGYVDRHFHSSETFVENTSTLAANAAVRERLFDGFRTEIVAIADGELLFEAEGDEASGDGGDDEDTDEPDADVPVTEEQIERDQVIESVLLDVFDSDLYVEVVTEQLATVQTQIVRASTLQDNELLRDNGQISIDVGRLYQPIYVALAADERTAEITENELPDAYGIYSIGDRHTTVNGVWWVIENAPSWSGLSTAVAVLALIGALVVAERRPSRAIQFGFGLVGVALVVIVIVYLVRAIVPVLTNGPTGPVVAAYVANTAPLVSSMVRLLIVGAVLAALGGIARLIWPDDWVYGQISDDRGVRSVQRRRGTPEPTVRGPQQQSGTAATAGYVPYGQQPYAPQPGWGYPGQPYGHMPYQYPVGPYAQPAPQQGAPSEYTQSAGHPTVPVMPIAVNNAQQPTADSSRPPVASNGAVNNVPADAAQSVPRVVASTDVKHDTSPEPAVDANKTDVASKADDWSSDGDW